MRCLLPGFMASSGIIVSLALAGPLYADGGFTITSYAGDNGKGYVTDVFDADLSKSPAWKSTDENPPVSAGNAIRSAATLRDARVRPVKERPWKLASADLCHAEDVDRWYWQIEFDRPDHDEEGREVGAQFVVIVLMNGVAVPPREQR
jgi:hypothetical protein